jgi:hypothetical protein
MILKNIANDRGGQPKDQFIFNRRILIFMNL